MSEGSVEGCCIALQFKCTYLCTYRHTKSGVMVDTMFKRLSLHHSVRMCVCSWRERGGRKTLCTLHPYVSSCVFCITVHANTQAYTCTVLI